MIYSACLEMLFTEVPFLNRIGKAKQQGFDAVEFWLWKPKDIKAIKQKCKENDITVGIFQGNIKGSMINPKDNKEYISGVKESLEVAHELECHNLFLMTDILREDRSVEPPPYEIPEKDKEQNILDVLNQLAPLAKEADVTLVIEPLNVIVDHPGYHLRHSKDGFEIIKKVNHRNIRLLYDIYHMQIMEGNIISTLENNIDLIGYIHIADVPGRHEPGTGEINFKNINKKLDEVNYKGIVGFEFEPTTPTEESLKCSRDIFKF